MAEAKQEISVSRRARALPLAAVLAIHVAGFAILLASSRVPGRLVESADAFVMLLLPEPPPRPETTPPERPPRRPAAANPRTLQIPVPPVTTAPLESSAPVALPPVDWQQEMQDTAKKKGDATPWRSVVPNPDKKPKHEFKWDRAHTRRIEVDEETRIPVLNLNDHCALIFFLVPGCRIGKIKPNGELFDGMNDPDRPTSSVPDAPTPDAMKPDVLKLESSKEP